MDNSFSTSSLNTNSHAVPLTAFGEVMIAPNIPHTAWRFNYGINTKLIKSTTANGGTTTVSESKAVLQTSTAVNGSASIETKRVLRYLPGVGALIRFTAVFGTPKADSIQIIGIGNLVDGYFFGYNGLQFGVLRRRNSVDTWVYESAFNGDKVTVDKTKNNIYSISYQWLGSGFIQFFIVDPDAMNKSELVTDRRLHVINYPNTSADVSVLNPTLPLFAYVANTGNNTNMTLQSASAVGFLQGGHNLNYNPLDVTNAGDAEPTLATTNNTQVLTIHNKTTLNSVANRVSVDFHELNVGRSAAGASLSTIRVYRNATFSGALTYADVDATNSPVEISTTSATITGGTVERSYVVTDGTTAFAIAFELGELIIYPDEYLTIAIQNNQATSTLLKVTVDWIEEF